MSFSFSFAHPSALKGDYWSVFSDVLPCLLMNRGVERLIISYTDSTTVVTNGKNTLHVPYFSRIHSSGFLLTCYMLTPIVDIHDPRTNVPYNTVLKTHLILVPCTWTSHPVHVFIASRLSPACIILF